MLASSSSSFAPFLPSLARRRRSLNILFAVPGNPCRSSEAVSFRAGMSSHSFSTWLYAVSAPTVSASSRRNGFYPTLVKYQTRRRVLKDTPSLFRTLCSVSSGQELEWREQQQLGSCSEDDTYTEHLLEIQQEKQSRFIPVKAYFISTRFPPDLFVLFDLSLFIPFNYNFKFFPCDCVFGSIDLRGLQAQNAFNVIPPTSRATNYVVLRYYDAKIPPLVSHLIFLFFYAFYFCQLGSDNFSNCLQISQSFQVPTKLKLYSIVYIVNSFNYTKDFNIVTIFSLKINVD